MNDKIEITPEGFIRMLDERKKLVIEINLAHERIRKLENRVTELEHQHQDDAR